MPERTAEEIRREIATERQGLADDLDALHEEVVSLKPVAIAAAVGVVLIAGRRAVSSGVKLVWRHL